MHARQGVRGAGAGRDAQGHAEGRRGARKGLHGVLDADGRRGGRFASADGRDMPPSLCKRAGQGIREHARCRQAGRGKEAEAKRAQA